MNLIAKKSCREGFENYLDLFLIWEHNGKVYKVRVRPQFGHDNKVLVSRAVQVPDGEPLEKYL